MQITTKNCPVHDLRRKIIACRNKQQYNEVTKCSNPKLFLHTSTNARNRTINRKRETTATLRRQENAYRHKDQVNFYCIISFLIILNQKWTAHFMTSLLGATFSFKIILWSSTQVRKKKSIKSPAKKNLLYYTSLKTGSYFNLKFKTRTALKSNVVYKFTCSRDVNTTYIGMSTRHLVTRAREHLQLNSNYAKSAISQHISSW